MDILKRQFNPVNFEFRDFFWRVLGPNNSWSTSGGHDHCDFCQNPAEYHSFSLHRIKSCERCLELLWKGQLDLLNPLFCKWIDKYFNLQTDTDFRFKEHSCYICYRDVIPSSKIRYVVIKDKLAIAHEGCIKNTGFSGFFTEQNYQDIIQQYIRPDLLKFLNELDSRQTNPRLISSPFDKIKINTMFDNSDFPIYVFNDGIESSFGPSNWVESTGDKCSFCEDSKVTGKNEHLDLVSCQSCLQEIIDGEFDVINPENHPVSKKIYDILCDYIKKNYHDINQAGLIFNDYKIKHNICYVCGNKIDNNEEEVAISGCESAMAHYECVKENGFVGLYTDDDFKDIIKSHFEEKIYDNIEDDS